MGNPGPAKICTNHVERQNLTIRIQMRQPNAADEWLKQEVGEPMSGVLPALLLLQLLPHSQDVARHARGGSGDYGTGLGTRGNFSLAEEPGSHTCKP
jgi:hypothetical protein